MRGVIARAADSGVGIRFIPLGSKSEVLKRAPRKAAGHLGDNPNDWVFALPDLYPMKDFDTTAFRHQSATELTRLLDNLFLQSAGELGLPTEVRTRWGAHCL